MNTQERDALLQVLKARFAANTHRHTGVAWADVQARLEARPDALQSLQSMEATGGEPDVVGRDEKTGESENIQRDGEESFGERDEGQCCYNRNGKNENGYIEGFGCSRLVIF